LNNQKPINIFITNVWSDKNKGDAAINISVIKMLRKIFPDANICVCSSFGANEISFAIRENYLTISENIQSFVGGLFPTFHGTHIDSSQSNVILANVRKMLRTLLSLIVATVTLIAACLRVVRVISLIMPFAFRKTLEKFLETDIVIVETDNISETSPIFGPYFIFKKIYLALLGVLLKKPVVFVGISIWQLKNTLSRLILKFIFNRSLFITVREPISYANVKKLIADRKKIFLIPDFTFCFYNEKYARKKYPRHLDKPHIGLAFVKWQDEKTYTNYLLAMIQLIKYILNKLRGLIFIVPQITYPPETPTREISYVLNFLGNPKDCLVIQKEMNVEKLLELYSEMDFVIGAPIHAVIFSMITGTPALAIEYEKGPKHLGIMKMLSSEDCLLTIDNITPTKLIDKFKNCWINRFKLHKEILSKTMQIYKQTYKYEILFRTLAKIVKHTKTSSNNYIM